jgi:hypothetical protein
MYITINIDDKDDIGNALVEKGFEKESKEFLKPHYSGKGSKINVRIESKIGADFLKALVEVAETLQLRGLLTQAKQSLMVLSDTNTAKIKSLRSFESGLVSYIQENSIKGWIFQLSENGYYVPYAVESINFIEGDPAYERKAAVHISLNFNSPMDSRGRGDRLSFEAQDVIGKTIPEILEAYRYVKETEELIAEYRVAAQVYLNYQPLIGTQFVATGYAKSKGYSNRLIQLDGKRRIKLVNDDESECSNRATNTYSTSYFWEGRDVPEGKFNEVPFHPYISMFDLNAHTHYWILSSQLSLYEYDNALGSKLILPDDHRDLVDILVGDMDVVVEDIVEGKSGGTTILCMGEPGLGKTLTAEVYSEVVGRPLYRVHSGQLGSNPETIEERLSKILERTEKWGAILLLDEADVYIRVRDNSMDHNAIVAAFLRKLEYFSGLMFMTTNRAKDVDDAIKSRCMAIVKFVSPEASDAKKIWQTLSKEFDMDLKESVIDDLVQDYPECSGRDIKELLKLAKKYNTMKKRPLDKETFRHCAIFRGISHR